MPARTLLQKPAPARPAPFRAAAPPRRGPFPAAVPRAPAAPRPTLDAGIARAERFGHHFGSLPATSSAPPSPAGAPIQRNGFWSTIGGWLGFGGQSQAEQERARQNAQRQAAIRRAQQEAAARRQADADRRAKALYEQEHAAYRRLDQIKGGKQHAEERQQLLRQLDGIQSAHSAHIEHVHQNNLKLWTPDRDQLDEAGRRQLDTAWNRLRRGKGLIKTPKGQGTEDINQDLRAMHARLLTGGQGRSLLYQLLDQEGAQTGHQVNILPRDPIRPGERQRNRAARRQVDAITPQLQRTQDELLRIMDEEGLNSLRNADVHAWKKGGNQARVQQLEAERQKLDAQLVQLRPHANPRDAAEAGPEQGGLGPNSQPGVGSGSVVNLMSGIKDSEYLNQDSQGRYIPAPAFIVYGHELIHALHNKRGTNSSGVNRDQYQQKPLSKWSDKEEHDTIAGAGISENALRAEHGLTPRGSHFGIAREDLEAQRGGGGRKPKKPKSRGK